MLNKYLQTKILSQKNFCLKIQITNSPLWWVPSLVSESKVLASALFSFCETGPGTCGLRHAKQVLTHCGTAPAPDNQMSPHISQISAYACMIHVFHLEYTNFNFEILRLISGRRCFCKSSHKSVSSCTPPP